MQTRYARQLVLPQLGEAAQSALADASVTIIGCGGLGTVAAAYLAGAGCGRLRLVDADRVDISNLHRQIMFTEADLGQPKAEALAAALTRRNSEGEYCAESVRATDENLPQLVADADLVLDCSDNFPTRYQVNAACARRRVGLVTAAAIRLEGLVLTLMPGRTDQACYQCVFPDDPHAADAESCQDAGVLGPSVGVVASLQSTQAITILTGRGEFNRLWRWDARQGEIRRLSLTPDPACPVCGTRSSATPSNQRTTA